LGKEMTNLEGNTVANQIIENITKELSLASVKPRLDIFQLGDNPQSSKYIDMKIKQASVVGINIVLHKYPEDVSEISILSEINDLNNSPQVNGIMVQLPLPSRFNTPSILNKIDPEKDVDGLTSINLGKLFSNQSDAILSATTRAVDSLLSHYSINVEGLDVVVLGSSIEVGLPISALMLNKKATVTICNLNTRKIDEKIQEADLLICATGTPGLVNVSNIKHGAIIIDVGFTIVDGKIYGDVDRKGMEYVARALSPVPGGVGPITIACLLQNTLDVWKKQNNG
jgi:methylenetetrahydrofolate dehydrogenase (NADP+)/methenyltetrahydrofolate cyclohydrolase